VTKRKTIEMIGTRQLPKGTAQVSLAAAFEQGLLQLLVSVTPAESTPNTANSF
jgi:hypothetical protein